MDMVIRRRKDTNRNHAGNQGYLQNLSMPEYLLPAGCGQIKSWSFMKSGLSVWGLASNSTFTISMPLALLPHPVTLDPATMVDRQYPLSVKESVGSNGG